MGVAQLQSTQRLTLREQTYQILFESILNGDLAPGTHLSEVTLAEHINVSRGTVREALRQLETQGLVVATGAGRLYVREFSTRDIKELFELRTALEAQAGILIINEGDVEKAVAELEKALPPADYREITFLDHINMDLDFHEKLCELSGNRMLLASWRDLRALMLVIVSSSPGARESVMTRTNHQPILDHLLARDAAGFHAMLSAHMEGAIAWWTGHKDGEKPLFS